MMIKIYLPAILLLVSILTFGQGTNYYIDATNGNDSNNGTSPATAWKTLTKVSGSSFSPGDSILFNRGEVWRGDFTINSSGTMDSPIVFGAYGKGDKPLFHQSINLNSTTDWTDLGSNLWATNNGSFKAHTGFVLFGEERPDNVGFKRGSRGAVNVARDYCYDATNDRVIVYCTRNPALEYSSIEIATGVHELDHFIQADNKSYIHIENFEVKYFICCGMNFTNCTGLEVRNCHITYGGGSEINSTRYGNGIQFWVDAKDCIVENCRVGQIYDSGVTPQGGSNVSKVDNLIFRNNILWGNDMAAYEIAFSQSATSLTDLYFLDNICVGNGYGWSHLQRPDHCGWDVATWTSSPGTWDGWYLKNKVYYESEWFNLYHRARTTPTNFEMDYNYYYKSAGRSSDIIDDHMDRYTMATFSNYQNKSGRDLNSKTGNRIEAQKLARSKVTCEDLFFLNTLFQEVDSIVIGNAPSAFSLSSPADDANVNSPVILSWEASTGSTSPIDHYEVWVDCGMVARVPADSTSYRDSLFTNGEHSWFVIAVCQDSIYWRQSSTKRIFTSSGGVPTYSLNIESGTGSGNYIEGKVVNISPNPQPGMTFKQWAGDTLHLGSPTATASNTVTMPAADVTVSATFDTIQYTLTVEDGTGGGTYTYGQLVDIAAGAAPEGQEFNQWAGDAAYIANKYDSATTITMPAENITVTATFKDISSGGSSSPLFNWNLEEGNILLDEGTAMQDLTNWNGVSTGGTEPNPPGYGSVGAVFDGTAKALGITNEEYGDRALNGADTDGTIYLAYTMAEAAGMFLWGIYQSVEGNRQIALYNNWGQPIFWFGNDDGNGAQQVAVEKYFAAGTGLVIGLSLDAATKKYTFAVWDINADEYYIITEDLIPLEGDYNIGVADMVIGGTTNLTHAHMNGEIYWVRIYDETHTLDEMKEIMEGKVTGISPNAKLPFNGVSVYPNPANTCMTINTKNTKQGFSKIEMYDQTGQKVHSTSQDVAFPYTVDISSFNTGIYFIRVLNDGKQGTVKMIKQ